MLFFGLLLVVEKVAMHPVSEMRTKGVRLMKYIECGVHLNYCIFNTNLQKCMKKIIIHIKSSCFFFVSRGAASTASLITLQYISPESAFHASLLSWVKLLIISLLYLFGNCCLAKYYEL